MTPRERLWDMKAEISEPGWDGGNAEPITAETVATADFIAAALEANSRIIHHIVPSVCGGIAICGDADEEFWIEIQPHPGLWPRTKETPI